MTQQPTQVVSRRIGDADAGTKQHHASCVPTAGATHRQSKIRISSSARVAQRFGHYLDADAGKNIVKRSRRRQSRQSSAGTHACAAGENGRACFPAGTGDHHDVSIRSLVRIRFHGPELTDEFLQGSEVLQRAPPRLQRPRSMPMSATTRSPTYRTRWIDHLP